MQENKRVFVMLIFAPSV